MIWRECTPALEKDFLQLTREPMGGEIPLVWGLETFRCPRDCHHFQPYLIQTDQGLDGCAMAWDWPGGHRYLSGLRFRDGMRARPRPAFWRTAFESLLAGVDYGWTSVGRDNHRARRVLESGAPWLPTYQPRQAISTWFVPLPSRQSNRQSESVVDADSRLTLLDWRRVAVHSGTGFRYWMGRMLHRLGRPGIPPPGTRMEIAHLQPSVGDSVTDLGSHLRALRELDGIVVVLPTDSEEAQLWRQAAPRTTWEWHSTLYSVSWTDGAPVPPVPVWKGYWL